MITPNDSPDIFPATPILSVSALNQAVARMLERGFPLTWVAGEISNFTRAASGHWYFTLKDSTAQVRAVMFRGRAQYADFIPRDGDRVELRTLVTLYAPRGDYQLNVEAIRRAGIGNLFEAFLRLKEKLGAEGLFDPARKRPLPLFARTIGIVTSPQAAALRDILSTLQRRAPHVEVILYPTPVQGEGAGGKIADAIRLASNRGDCDVLLLCRGGGSMEDLWSFNEEAVARAIVDCNMPVIAGVGHETDFTIADFAADLRAPTPTAAAEMAATPRADWLATIMSQADALLRASRRQLSDRGQTLDWLSHRLLSPKAAIARERQQLQALGQRLRLAERTRQSAARFALTQISTRLGAQRPDSAARRNLLHEHARRLAAQLASAATQHRQALAALAAQLELLNPQRTLERGYAIATNAKGQVIRSPNALHPRDTVTLRLAGGSAQIGIASVQPVLESLGSPE
ncbi:exodeoxyribonuclease VII large subunit [Herminiimonas sp. CN]|uniref:exodeoxyribonuclease VII large subunit n=1 Tax=Herminiimonas sp. CN TaxID=1349818 RepID=UPI00047364BE|nr:exodeoxyribonuclease VII large subunit [Herminiimonas sp. CN]